jgi:hypothetical protein
MRSTPQLTILAIILGGAPFISAPSFAQGAKKPANAASEFSSMPDCARPTDAKRAKVIEFDPASSFAKVAVELAAGRFKVVGIKIWDRPEDPRPLVPVIEAARITQGNIEFYAPDLNEDPESAHESFLLRTDMGGGAVCWATPSALLKDGSKAAVTSEAPAVMPAGQAATPAGSRILAASVTGSVTSAEAPTTIEVESATPQPRTRSRTPRRTPLPN